MAGKTGSKIRSQDDIQFNTENILKEYINLVDYNDGRAKQFDLSFMEFDGSLSANLDFKSSSCLKALLTNLGVEEMRAILHYQIMQQQLLTVAVKTNQLILDGP